MDFVVGVLSFFENEIELEKISAESEKEALMKHSLLNGYIVDKMLHWKRFIKIYLEVIWQRV